MAKNRLTYIFVLAALLTFVYLREEYMTYAALYAALALPPLSWLILRIGRRRLRIAEALEMSVVHKGGQTVFLVTLQNPSILPTFARIEIDPGRRGALAADGIGRHLALPARGEVVAAFQISAKHRGVFEIGVTSISRYDALGLFRVKQRHDATCRLTVMPLVHPLESLPLIPAIPDATAQTVRHDDEDYTSVSDLRKYQPTDPYKKIHWKMTAKRGELISKNFEATQKTSAIFYLDNSPIAASSEFVLAAEDAMLEALVSAAKYCTELAYPLSLRYPAAPETDFTTDFAKLYRIAAAVEFDADDAFETFLRHDTIRPGLPMNLVLFAQIVTPALCTILQDLQLTGRNVILYYFKAGEGMEDLHQAGVHCIHYNKEAAQ